MHKLPEDQTRLLAHAKKLYASEQTIEEIIAEFEGDRRLLRTLNRVLVDHLNSRDSPHTLAEEHSIDQRIVVEFLHGFDSLALKAWKNYLEQNHPSIAAAAESVGMKRFCFDDYFRNNNGIDDNDHPAFIRYEAARKKFQATYKDCA